MYQSAPTALLTRQKPCKGADHVDTFIVSVVGRRLECPGAAARTTAVRQRGTGRCDPAELGLRRDGQLRRQPHPAVLEHGRHRPFLIELLPAKQVHELREQILEQLNGPGTGLDDVPLRAFAEIARLYTETAASSRFTQATFGAISQPATGGIVGQVSWPGGVTGSGPARRR